MTSYEDAAGYLGSKTDRPSPNHGEKATRVHRVSESAIAVRYHRTDVVTYHADGSIVLDNGGWQTSTTKNRIGEYSPVRVFCESGLWYACLPGQWETAKPYANGLTYHADGTLTGFGAEDTAAVKRKLDRRVRKYISDFCASVASAKKLDAPGNGDCLGCLFTARETAPAGKPGIWGTSKPAADEPMGYSHYLTHLDDKYFVPSLVWRAVQRRGNPSFVYQLMQADAERGRVDMLRRELGSFFRRIKPALMTELAQLSTGYALQSPDHYARTFDGSVRLFRACWRQYRAYLRGSIDGPQSDDDVRGWLDSIAAEKVNDSCSVFYIHG